MTEKEERSVIWIAVVFLVVAVAGMGLVRRLYGTGEDTDGSNLASRVQEGFDTIDGTEMDIMIPLSGQEADQFHFSESIRDKMLEVTLEDTPEDFFHQNRIKGNDKKIAQVFYLQNDGKATLQFWLKDIYEAEFQVEGDNLCIRLEYPTEKWDKIVVLEGNAWTSQMVDQLAEEGIKGILSGDVDTANSLRADVYLSLEVESGTAEEAFGDRVPETEIIIYYNDDYFIPDFDSRTCAQLLCGCLSQEYGEDHVSIKKTDEWDLEDAMIPAVRIVCSMWNDGAEKLEETIIRTVILHYQEKEEAQ